MVHKRKIYETHGRRNYVFSMKLLKLLLIGGVALVVVLGFSVLLKGDAVPALKRNHYYTQGNIVIESIDHKERNVSDDKPFSRFEGSAFGLHKHVDFSPLDFDGPFLRVSAIASGDFNNDGWRDILLGDRRGVILYKNLGTNIFVLQEIAAPEIENLSIIVAAFVDIDNDGWQDIYVTSYGGENYFILNDKRGFQNPKLLKSPNGKAIITHAVSFFDLDRDGYLDFVNGNWLFGGKRPFASKLSENQLVISKNLQFQEKNLEEITGETLSVLLADFTNDHNPDLIVGNDFYEPDIFYVGNAIGELVEIKKADHIIPVSAYDTMSVDIADFNNDLYMDIYVGATSGVPDPSLTDSKNGYCFEINNIEEKQKCESNLKIWEIIKKRDLESCRELANTKDGNDCMIMITLNLAVGGAKEESLCDKIPKNYPVQKLRCHDYFTPGFDRISHEEAIPQIGGRNVLLQGSKEGAFQDVSDKTGSDSGGWSWNAKFADVDNDEWQDIYIANGRWNKTPPHSNVFFHNQEGQFFQTKQEEFNLENYNMVVAYTYVDIDNDGDLDIVTAGHNGPINVYLNNETENNSITFEFRDKKGNHSGIGNKIYIYYGEDSQRHQVRELKLGGGFLSFDAPIAHFGLGKYDRAHKIEIVWSTGEKTIIDKEFLANKKYVISREK